MKTNIFKEENLFLTIFTKMMTSFIISVFITFVVSLLFGYKYMIVKTPSMEPTLHVHELIILAPTEFEDLEILDIITFKSSGEGTMSFTHRVRGVAENGELITAGDANIDTGTGEIKYDNSTVSKDIYVGKVVGDIYSVGLLIMFLKENIMTAGLIMIIGFVAYILLCDEEEDSVY